MKKIILLAALIIAFGLKGHSQFAFGVAPGLSTNSAYFGFNTGKVVPYVGFQFMNAGLKLEMTDHYYDGVEWNDDDGSETIGINLYMPVLGFKFFALESNDLKAYFNLSATKPLLRGKMKDDAGNENEEFAKTLKDIKILGGQFGFGVEYYFSSNFSIGGEYGIMYLGGSYKSEEEYTSGGEDALRTTTIKPRIMPTYSKFSLNYYFGGGEE
jgi:hypothetical protein